GRRAAGGGGRRRRGRPASRGRPTRAPLRRDPAAARHGAPPRGRATRHDPRIPRSRAARRGRTARRGRQARTRGKEYAMRRQRVVWGTAALVTALALIVFIPRLGFTNAGAPLWTERPAMSWSPRAQPAPSPWVELARTLKPAVVNISTKRVQEGRSALESPFGSESPFNG